MDLPGLNFGDTAARNSDMKLFVKFCFYRQNLVDQNRLEGLPPNNLVKNGKSIVKMAKNLHELWRSLELRIFIFFCKTEYLTTSTIRRSERTAFVVFLEKSKV